jgi:hypothetical protein
VTDIHITRQELSKRLKIPVNTLNAWASEGKGPRYASFGRHARYRLDDVIRWENEQFGDVDPHREVARD